MWLPSRLILSACALATTALCVVAWQVRPLSSRRAAVPVTSAVQPQMPFAALPVAFHADGPDTFVTLGASARARVTRTGIDVATAAAGGDLAIRFAGGSPRGSIQAAGRMRGYVNYLAGEDRSRWRTRVPLFARVRMPDVYRGIDIEYYGAGPNLEYDLIVAPQADPAFIRIALDVRGGVEITRDGDLALRSNARVVQRRPVAFQRIDGVRRQVPANYTQHPDGTFGIALGSYDTTRALIIDPVVVYAFTFGGSDEDGVSQITVDDAGAVYVAGATRSVDLPTTPGVLQPSKGAVFWSTYILKLNAAGSEPEWLTYLDTGGWMRVNETHDVFLAGGGRVQRLSADGTSLVYSTAVAELSGVQAFAVSPGGTAYVSVSVSSGCFDNRVYRVSSGGVALNVTGSARCEFSSYFPFVAAGPDGDGYVFVARLDGSLAALQRFKPDGTLVYHRPVTPLVYGEPVITPDGSAVLPRRYPDGIALHHFSPDGVLVDESTPWPSANPSTEALRALAREDSGRWHAITCNSVPATNCRVVDTNARGDMIRAVPVPAAAAFAFDRAGSLYSVTSADTPASFDGNVTVTKRAFVRIDDLSANTAMPVRWGTPVTWTAGPAPVTPTEYSFYRFDQPTGWTQVQDWSTTRTYTWTPGYADIGTHQLQVWARPIGSTAAYEDWRGIEFGVDAGPPIATSLTASAPLYLHTRVTWTANAIGGYGPLEYKFVLRDQGVWSIVQDYGPSNTYALDLPHTGFEALQVWVRNVGSPASYEAYASVPIDVIFSPITAVLQASHASPVAPGTPVTWTVTATGGAPPLQYKFLRLDADGWHVVQEFSGSTTFTYTPSAADVGDHSMQVWVRQANSTAVHYDAWTGQAFTVGVPPQPLQVALHASVPVPVPAGTPITWTAAATGGIAPLSYLFVQRANGGSWQVVQGYGPSSTYTASLPPGTYDLQVWVRNAASVATFDAWAGTTFDVNGPQTLMITALQSLYDTWMTTGVFEIR